MLWLTKSHSYNKISHPGLEVYSWSCYEIFVIPPWTPEVAVPSDQWTGGVLFVPFASTSTRQTHAFSVVGPSIWNGLPLALRLLPKAHPDAFYSSLKTALFSRAGVGSASEQLP